MIRFIDWFSGIGGCRLALESTDRFHCIAWSEIDKNCRAIHAARWPGDTEAMDLGDIRKLKPEDVPDAELWVGGFPCQPYSVAGRRRGLLDDRSNVLADLLRLAEAKKPGMILLENVPGLLSGDDSEDEDDGEGSNDSATAGRKLDDGTDNDVRSWFGEVLRALADIGYDAEWVLRDARWFGVPQRRRRLFILARRAGAESVRPILLDAQGGGGNPAKGGQQGANVAADAARGTGIVGCLNSGGNQGGFRTEPGEHLIVSTTHETSPCIQERQAKGPDSDATQAFVIAAAPLTSGQSSKGVNPPGRRKEDDENLVVGTLRSHPRPGSNMDYTVIQDVRGTGHEKKQHGIGIQQGGPMYTLTGVDRHGIAHALTGEGHDASEDGTGRGTPIIFEPGNLTRRCGSAPNESVAPTLGAEKQGDTAPHLLSGMLVRRLSPTECERLQGFPDGHTCVCGIQPDCPARRIPSWINPATVVLGGCGHSACGCACADSPRYRALGNSVAVPAVRAIANRLLEALA